MNEGKCFVCQSSDIEIIAKSEQETEFYCKTCDTQYRRGVFNGPPDARMQEIIDRYGLFTARPNLAPPLWVDFGEVDE